MFQIISLTIILESFNSVLKADLHLISSIVQLKVFVTLLCGHGIIHACYTRIRACVASAWREFNRYARKREDLREAYASLTSYVTLSYKLEALPSTIFECLVHFTASARVHLPLLHHLVKNFL